MNNRNSAAGWLVVLLRDSEIDMNKKTKKKKKLCGRIWECAIYLFFGPSRTVFPWIMMFVCKVKRGEFVFIAHPIDTSQDKEKNLESWMYSHQLPNFIFISCTLWPDDPRVS